ncbi:unnamed protein product [Acanthoscelides obtectus]|uniref:Uncharacterized protein n=1 Tax=Acanthoscelides obtectus TaxID=200917 RepID=A0A9P0MC67_ACAOB|nr:unnamed protein product [Acanthoscelides obtectus]CAK1623169.1 hypothetical protein AOBTE_LOCUS1852 [Acanthoscelides obtectus]
MQKKCYVFFDNRAAPQATPIAVCWTYYITFSNTLERTGKRLIGLKSLTCSGLLVLGSGITSDTFHNWGKISFFWAAI